MDQMTRQAQDLQFVTLPSEQSELLRLLLQEAVRLRAVGVVSVESQSTELPQSTELGVPSSRTPAAPPQIIIQTLGSFNQGSYNTSDSSTKTASLYKSAHYRSDRFNTWCALVSSGFICLAMLLGAATLLWSAQPPAARPVQTSSQ